MELVEVILQCSASKVAASILSVCSCGETAPSPGPRAPRQARTTCKRRRPPPPAQTGAGGTSPPKRVPVGKKQPRLLARRFPPNNGGGRGAGGGLADGRFCARPRANRGPACAAFPALSQPPPRLREPGPGSALGLRRPCATVSRALRRPVGRFPWASKRSETGLLMAKPSPDSLRSPPRLLPARVAGGTLVALGGVILLACGPAAGGRVPFQARFKQLDKFESVKTQQPDIIILQRESAEAPLGSYMPQAIPEFNELMSEFLSDMQPARAMPWKHLAWQKKQRWSSHKTKRNFFKKRRSRFVQGVERRVKSRPADRRDSDSQTFDESARINLSRRLKRSFSSRKKENSLEDVLPNMLQTQEQKESRQTGTFRKRRAAEAAEEPLGETDHLARTALETQQKLSEMVARLSDPSNDMTQGEKLSYMRELLNELQLFIQMLQQQILLQSLREVQDVTTPPTGGPSSRLERR